MVLEQLKERESRGYTFELADASLELLMRRASGWTQPFFEIDSYRVHVEERVGDDEAPLAEATVKVRTKGSRHIESAEGHGPVGALDDALRKALTNDYPELRHIELEDYRVRVLAETHGTGAVVRVLIDSSNGERSWTTVGVSENIIEASWEALTDAYLFGLLHPRRRGRARWEPGPMELRTIGSIPVPLAGIGCNNFGRRIDEERTREVVDAAFEADATLFDTADTLRRRALRGVPRRALGSRRDRAVIVSKFGMRKPPDGMTGGDPRWVVRACEDSLRRLGTDRIDVYLLHTPDDATPIGDTLTAMSRMVDEGKVREIGCSNFSAKQLDEAAEAARELDVRPFVTVQNEYSLLEREPRGEVLAGLRPARHSASCRTSRSRRGC